MSNRRTRKPTHPGELLKETVLPGYKLTQNDFAERLGVSRRTVIEILHERRSVTPDVAQRLARLLTNTTPEFWMNMQGAVDLWEAEQRFGDEYQGIKPAKAADAA